MHESVFELFILCYRSVPTASPYLNAVSILIPYCLNNLWDKSYYTISQKRKKKVFQTHSSKCTSESLHLNFFNLHF